MKCPVCKDVTLLMSEKKGIEIDYCPECRGIWLDKGELEKLTQKEENYYQEKNNYHSNNYEHNKAYPKKKKKESFFEEIFDVFGD